MTYVLAIDAPDAYLHALNSPVEIPASRVASTPDLQRALKAASESKACLPALVVLPELPDEKFLQFVTQVLYRRFTIPVVLLAQEGRELVEGDGYDWCVWPQHAAELATITVAAGLDVDSAALELLAQPNNFDFDFDDENDAVVDPVPLQDIRETFVSPSQGETLDVSPEKSASPEETGPEQAVPSVDHAVVVEHPAEDEQGAELQRRNEPATPNEGSQNAILGGAKSEDMPGQFSQAPFPSPPAAPNPSPFQSPPVAPVVSVTQAVPAAPNPSPFQSPPAAPNPSPFQSPPAAPNPSPFQSPPVAPVVSVTQAAPAARNPSPFQVAPVTPNPSPFQIAPVTPNPSPFQAAPVAPSPPPDTVQQTHVVTQRVQAPVSEPANPFSMSITTDVATKKSIIFVAAAKGGSGKTTCALCLSERAAHHVHKGEQGVDVPVLNVLYVDADRGNGGSVTFLGVEDTASTVAIVPTIMDRVVRPTEPGSGVVPPAKMNAARNYAQYHGQAGKSVPPVHFASILGPAALEGSPERATAELYVQLIEETLPRTDIVVVDTPIADREASRQAYLDALLKPFIGRRDVELYIVVVDDFGGHGKNLEYVLHLRQDLGIPAERIYSYINRWEDDTKQAMVSFEDYANELKAVSTFLGQVGYAESIALSGQRRVPPHNDPALAPMLDTVLGEITGRSGDLFSLEAYSSRRAKWSLRQLFGRKQVSA